MSFDDTTAYMLLYRQIYNKTLTDDESLALLSWWCAVSVFKTTIKL